METKEIYHLLKQEIQVARLCYSNTFETFLTQGLNMNILEGLNWYDFLGESFFKLRDELENRGIKQTITEIENENYFL